VSTELIPLESLTRSERTLLDERYQPMRDVLPDVEWEIYAPYVAAIEALKKERNAVILAHNYQAAEIFHGVADLVGDSLAMAYRSRHAGGRRRGRRGPLHGGDRG
jgi:quinolinate synthase